MSAVKFWSFGCLGSPDLAGKSCAMQVWTAFLQKMVMEVECTEGKEKWYKTMSCSNVE